MICASLNISLKCIHVFTSFWQAFIGTRFLNTRSINVNQRTMVLDESHNISINLTIESLYYDIMQVHTPTISFMFVFFLSPFFSLARRYAMSRYSDISAEISADFIFVGHASADHSTYGGNSHDSHGSLHREIA